MKTLLQPLVILLIYICVRCADLCFSSADIIRKIVYAIVAILALIALILLLLA